MPRGSRKRKATSSNPQEKKMWSSGSSRKKSSRKGSSTSMNESAAESLFDSIADPDDPSIATMEGISTLCDQLELDIEDIRILVLLWKMNAVDKPAQISKEEWMTACNKMHIDSLEKIQSLLPMLDTGFMDHTEYKEFYKFCFQFNRQGTHRTLDKDLVVALLQIVVKDRIPQDRIDSFCTFLETCKGYTRITLDQWTSFLDFCHDVQDLSAYDQDSSAWPVMIDEYVEYMEKQDKMAT